MASIRARSNVDLGPQQPSELVGLDWSLQVGESDSEDRRGA